MIFQFFFFNKSAKMSTILCFSVNMGCCVYPLYMFQDILFFLDVGVRGPGWNDPMTAVVPRVKGFACYSLSFSRHNKNIKMEHFFLYILSRYFI